MSLGGRGIGFFEEEFAVMWTESIRGCGLAEVSAAIFPWRASN
jgi:hypothetical protein